MMLICIQQQLSNIWSSIHETVSNTEAELKKSVAYKKNVCYTGVRACFFFFFWLSKISYLYLY